MGYTLEQLQKAGFTPVPEEGPKRLTYEEAIAAGFKPPPEDPLGLNGPVDLAKPYQSGGVTPHRAVQLGTAQGATMGFADELGAGAVSKSRFHEDPNILGPQFALSPDDTPEIRKIKLEALDQQMKAIREDPLAYQPFRDRMRAEAAAAQKQHPREYMEGELAGSMLTSLLPGGQPAMGGSALKNTMALLGTGAGLGAASGLGASNAPLSDPQALVDTAKGAGWGLGGALAGAAIGKGAPMLVRALGRGAEKGAINATRRVMLSGAKQLGDKGKIKMPDAVPLEALKSGAIVPFGTTEGTLGRLTAQRQAQSKTYGEIIETLENAGVEGKDARLIARDLLFRSAEVRPRTMNEAIPDLYLSEAEKVVAKAQEGARAGIAKKGRLGLSQAEDLKRSLQDQVRYGKIEDTKLNEARSEIASVLRQANEDAIMEAARRNPGTEISEAAESFVPVKQRLGRLIEAERATQQGVQRGSTRGSGPGVVEMTAATATGNPAPLVGRMALNVARNRGPSTAAATLFPISRGLAGASNLMNRMPVAARMAAGAGLGAAAGRALAMEPKEPGVPEPPPEGSDLDFERWRLEQELRGNSRPAGAPLRRLVKKGRQ